MKIIHRCSTRGAIAVIFSLLFLVVLLPTCAAQPRDPRAEIELRKSRFSPPPVNEAAASRAQKAAHARARASISDLVELAIKRGNEAMVKLPSDPATFTEEDWRFYAQAETNYKRALQLNPKEWRAFSGLGNVYYRNRLYAEAAKAFQQATALRPNDAELQLRLGFVYADSHQAGPAIRAFARSIEIDPSKANTSAYYSLAFAYRDAKLFDEGIQTFQRLQGAYPDAKSLLAYLYTNQGTHYRRQKDFAKAIEAYKNGLRLVDSDAIWEGHRDEVVWLLGEAFLEIHDLKAAREKQRELAQTAEAIEKQSGANVAVLYTLRSHQLLEDIKLAEQIEAAAQVVRTNPNDANAHFRMGNGYFEWNNPFYFIDHYSEAIEQYKETIRLTPNFTSAYYNLGLAELYRGNKSGAMTQYQALKQLKSDYADELLAKINKQ